jgi:hypothetical protein
MITGLSAIRLRLTAPLFALLAPTSIYAAEITSPEITKLLTGNTLYFEFANPVAGTGQGALYYGADGKVLTKMPNGQKWKGTWTVKPDNSACFVWEVGPEPGCTKYDKTGDTTTSINAADGKPRGKLVKAVPGNAENL